MNELASVNGKSETFGYGVLSLFLYSRNVLHDARLRLHPLWVETQTIFIPEYGSLRVVCCVDGGPAVPETFEQDGRDLVFRHTWCTVEEARAQPLEIEIDPVHRIGVQLLDRGVLGERAEELIQQGLLSSYFHERTAYPTAQYNLPLYHITVWGMTLYALSLYGINMRYRAYLRQLHRERN
jgi:hypothetical protein